MKKKRMLFMLICTLLFSSTFAQKNKQYENLHLADELFQKANALNFFSNPDSISRSYELLESVLALNSKHTSAYEAKICIDYKRCNYSAALETARTYTKEMPGWGNSWTYFGIVQHKLKDTVSANLSFLKALEKYRNEARAWKSDRNSLSYVEAKASIVKNFLGTPTPVFSKLRQTKQQTHSISASIAELDNMHEFIEKFMTYNGIQFL